MTDRPRFTRKARPRLDADERAQLIAAIADNADGDTPAAFDLPHVEETSPPEPAELAAELDEIWEPDLEPADHPRLAAEEVFAAEAIVEEFEHEPTRFEEAFFVPPAADEDADETEDDAWSEEWDEDQDDGQEDLTDNLDQAGDEPAPTPPSSSISSALAALAQRLGRPPAEDAGDEAAQADETPAETYELAPKDALTFEDEDLPAPPETDEDDANLLSDDEPAEAAEDEDDDVKQTAVQAAANPIPGPAPEPAPSPDAIWAHLRSIPVDPGHLERNLIITAGRHDPAHGAFDVLRTRLVQTLHDNDWKRVAVTSPTRDCGKTFTAVNLAISLSRYEAMRTVLMDMDMRNPSVAAVLGAADPGSMGDFLQGGRSVSDHFIRLGRNALNIGANLAVGLNDRVEPFASELIQDPRSDAAFARMMAELDPDVVLYDLPPALAYDDVIAFKKHFDGVLMVVGGGTTTAAEVQEAMRRLGTDVPLLGVVLNQAEGEAGLGYTYGY